MSTRRPQHIIRSVATSDGAGVSLRRSLGPSQTARVAPFLLAGGAQWISAGRGILHPEMPQQESGRMRGFLRWIKLPAAEKIKPVAYHDIRPEETPQAALTNFFQLPLEDRAFRPYH